MKTLHDADSILLALLQAADEAESQKLQEKLLLEHAAPIIRQILRLRLQGELGPLHTRGLDADDLFNDVYVRLMERLRELRLQPDGRIRNFLVYVARVTTNVCHDVLRAKKQNRHLLKHKLRNLCSRHPDFVVWKGENNVFFCGLTWWNEQAIPPQLSEPVIEEWIARLRTETFAHQNPAVLPLSKLAFETLTTIDHAVALDALAHLIASLQGLRERHTESLDDVESGLRQRLPDAAPLSDARIEGHEHLQSLWSAIKQLPLAQRKAICFSTEDSSGEDLLSVLIGKGIVTAPELAAEFGLTNEGFYELLARLPLADNKELADTLGVSGKQAS